MNNKTAVKKGNTLQYLLLGKKGGKTSAKIIEKLLIRPYNSNQLANTLNLSYNTIQYHIRIMLKYELIEKTSSGYGSIYEPSQKLLNESDTFYELKKLI